MAPNFLGAKIFIIFVKGHKIFFFTGHAMWSYMVCNGDPLSVGPI